MKPCDIWEGHPSQRYGSIKIAGVSLRVHRLVWMQDNGPIPEGMSILHSCDNSRCIEITHLRLGTHAENMHDRDSRGRNYLLSRDECPNGHPFDGENTHVRADGARVCKECRRAADRRYKAKRRAA